MKVLDGHSSGVWALAASGRTLVSGSADQMITVWGILRNDDKSAGSRGDSVEQ